MMASTSTRPPLSDVTNSISNNQSSADHPRLGEGKLTAKDASAKSKKRKIIEDPKDRSWLDIEVPEFIIEQSPAQVRNKIRRFIDNGGMTVKDFCSAIGVSTVSYYRFMNAGSGTKGSASETYYGALRLFKKRDLAGLPMPTKKKAKTDASGSDGKKTNRASKAEPVDLSGIYLDGQEDDEVQVFDTCSEVRKKIAAYLRKPGVTASSFLREISAQLYGPRRTGKVLQSKQLNDFRGYKLPSQGNSSTVFYAAYVFFEKVRIKEGKPKSAHRLEMEQEWPNGFDLVLHRGGYLIAADSMVVENEYGQVRSVRDPGYRGWSKW